MLERAVTEKLRKITKSKDVLLETKVKITHIIICPVTMSNTKVGQLTGMIRKNGFI